METQEEYQAKRQHAKKLREAYRSVARRMGADVVASFISVPSRSHVQPNDEGAFVEVVMWVPKAAAEAYVVEEAARLAAEELAKRCANGHVWSNDFGDDWKPEVGTPCDCRQRAWGTIEHGGD